MATRAKQTVKKETKTIVDIFTSNIMYKFKKTKLFLCDNSLSDHKSIIVSFEISKESKINSFQNN